MYTIFKHLCKKIKAAGERHAQLVAYAELLMVNNKRYFADTEAFLKWFEEA